jgi:streptogramin lyase
VRLARIVTLACAATLLPATASAAPALDGTFTPTGTPTQIARGPDGNVWFVLTGSSAGKEFGRIAPDGTITEYDTPNNLAAVGIGSGPSTPGGPSDSIWLTQEQKVVRWNPAAATGQAFDVATLAGPRDIAAGADGNMWAVAIDRVIRLTPDNATKTDFLIGQVGGRGIARGSDDRMYLADFGNQALQAFTTANPNAPQKIDLGVAPQEVEPGPAGQLAVSLPNSEMARVTSAGAVEKTTDNASDPFGIAYGNDGAYWIAQFTTQNVARLTPAGELTKPITLPPGSGPRYIAAGANNTLWVTAETSKKIHRITGVAADEPPPPPPPPPDTTAPQQSGLRVSVRKRQLKLELSEAATLDVRLEVKRNGRRSGTKCKPLKKGQRTSKPCRYWKRAKLISFAGAAGTNIVPLGSKLASGASRAVVTATDTAGNASAPATVGFKV